MRRPTEQAVVKKCPACKSEKSKLIAKDDDAEYVECLACGTIYEAKEAAEPSGFGESLSDA